MLAKQSESCLRYLTIVHDDAVLDQDRHLKLTAGQPEFRFVLVPQQVEPYEMASRSRLRI
jgi:hypothetical protein